MRLWHDLLAKLTKGDQMIWVPPTQPAFHMLFKKTPATILSQVSICYISQEFIASGFLILLFHYLQSDLSGMVLSHHSSLYSTDIFPWQQQPNLKIPIFGSHTHYLNLCMWPSLHWHHGQVPGQNCTHAHWLSFPASVERRFYCHSFNVVSPRPYNLICNVPGAK